MDRVQFAQDSPVVSSYQHSNELSGSMKGEEFLDQMSDCASQE
jgi:hypothetical protein